AVAETPSHPCDDPKEYENVAQKSFREPDHEFGEGRKGVLTPEIFEHGFEARYDPGQHHEDHTECNQQDAGWIHHGSSNLAHEIDSLFDVGCEALQDGV